MTFQKEFKNLKSLDLFNNEATTISNYRELIFDLIPSLKFLDGFDAEDREAEDSENEDEEVNGNEDDSEEGEGWLYFLQIISVITLIYF